MTPKLVRTPGVRVDVPFGVWSPPEESGTQAEPLGIDNTEDAQRAPPLVTATGDELRPARRWPNFLRGGVGLFAGRPAFRWFDEAFVHTGPGRDRGALRQHECSLVR